MACPGVLAKCSLAMLHQHSKWPSLFLFFFIRVAFLSDYYSSFFLLSFFLPLRAMVLVASSHLFHKHGLYDYTTNIQTEYKKKCKETSDSLTAPSPRGHRTSTSFALERVLSTLGGTRLEHPPPKTIDPHLSKYVSSSAG